MDKYFFLLIIEDKLPACRSRHAVIDSGFTRQNDAWFSHTTNSPHPETQSNRLFRLNMTMCAD
jgi:hypothetical protein